MISNRPAAESADAAIGTKPVDQSRPGLVEPGRISLFDPNARQLARAAIDLDTGLIVQIVQASVDTVGVVSTWEQLVQPVWRYLGSRTGDNDQGAAAEHLYVQSAMTAMSGQNRTTAGPAQIDEVLDAQPDATIIAAGPGWATANLSPRAIRSTDVSTALVLTLAVLEGHNQPADEAGGTGVIGAPRLRPPRTPTSLPVEGEGPPPARWPRPE